MSIYSSLDKVRYAIGIHKPMNLDILAAAKSIFFIYVAYLKWAICSGGSWGR